MEWQTLKDQSDWMSVSIEPKPVALILLPSSTVTLTSYSINFNSFGSDGTRNINFRQFLSNKKQLLNRLFNENVENRTQS